MSSPTPALAPRLKGGRPPLALSLRVHAAAGSGATGRLSLALGRLEASVVGLEAFVVQTAADPVGGTDLTIYVSHREHEAAVRQVVDRLEGFEVMGLDEGGTVLAPIEGEAAGHHPLAS